MERNIIVRTRIAMIVLVATGIFLLDKFKDSPSFNSIAFFIGLAFVVCLVAWISYEAQGSNREKKEREVVYHDTKYVSSEGPSLYRIILVLAAIATIIMAISHFA